MTQPATSPSTGAPLNADALMTCILAILAPLLLAGAGNDGTLARLAAQQAIAACQAQKDGNLVGIAQILGFALTALDNLRLSAPDDLSLSMKLKLRGNANALNRSSQQASATPHPHPANASATPAPQPPPTEPEETPSPAQLVSTIQETATLIRQAQTTPPDEVTPPAQTTPPAEVTPTTNPQAIPRQDSQPLNDRQRQLAWASAMTDVAAECAAELAHLPSGQRRIQSIRIGALTRTAHDLTRGQIPLKARLLGTTSLQT